MDDIYLKELVIRMTSVLKEKLNSLYLIGSASLGDYIEHRSDVDILGITNTTLTNFEKDQLAHILDFDRFPCPAEGLDMVLITQQNIEHIQPQPAYEFWFSTGAHWPKEQWEAGGNEEMLIFIEQCRQNGVKIYGNGPAIHFSIIDRKLVLKAFKKILLWHKKYILDEYHDPGGQNSVLNACRILMFVENNQFYSKTGGGKAFLKKYPDQLTVQKALSIRQNESGPKITAEEILEFLIFGEKKLDQEM